MKQGEKKDNPFIERLRWAREQAGLSQGQVARLLDLHRPTISQIESGERNVKVEELKMFAELYEVREEWLLHGEVKKDDKRDAKIELAARELSKLKKSDLDAILKLIQVVKTRQDNSR